MACTESPGWWLGYYSLYRQHLGMYTKCQQKRAFTRAVSPAVKSIQVKLSACVSIERPTAASKYNFVTVFSSDIVKDCNALIWLLDVSLVLKAKFSWQKFEKVSVE